MTADARADAAPEIEQGDPLSLARVLHKTPPAALIKDDEPDDGKDPPDRFATKGIAERLAAVIERIEPPYTVSLSGSWGVGKTWVAKRLPSLLKGKVPVVEVDLWSEDISELRRTLAVEVAVRLAEPNLDEAKLEKLRGDKADELDKELRRPELVAAPVRTFAPALKTRRGLLAVLVAAAAVFAIGIAISQPAPAAGAPSLPWIGPVVSGAIAILIVVVLQSGMVLSVAQPSSSLAPIREAVALRKNFVSFVTSHPDRKVLVVLDNLDRLAGEDAVQTLGEIRSFVELRKSRCIFLVPLDRGALERHLVHTMGGDEQAARDYLDKFFNLDLVLTSPTAADLRGSILGLLTDLFPGQTAATLRPVAELVGSGAAGSPRAAKRIVNGVYARAYLVPETERAQVTLPDVAFIEVLVARFPGTIAQLNNDTERSIRRVNEIRRHTEGVERTSQILALLGRRSVAPASDEDKKLWVQEQQRHVQALLDFLLFTRPTVPSADVIRTLLTVRPNRQLGPLADPGAAERALKAGDATALRTELGSLSGEELHEALVGLLDEVKVDLAAPWRNGARAGLNALAPVAVVDARAIDMLRTEAADYLIAGDASDFRALKQETLMALFPKGARGTPRGAALAERAVASIATASSLPVVGVVRFVVATADALVGSKLDEAKGALAKLSDDELNPLFAIGVSGRLLPGPVTDLYVARLVALDPEAALAPLEAAADRLSVAQDRAEWDGSEALIPVFDRLTTVLATPAATESLLPLLEKVAALTEDLESDAHLDTLALRLVSWAPGGLRAIELALELPTSDSAIAAPLTTLMNGFSDNDFLSLAGSHAEDLEYAEVEVADMAATRWSAGMGSAYLVVAVTSDDPARFEGVFAALAAVSDIDTYVSLLAGLGERIVVLKSADAAAKLVANVAGRIAAMPLATAAKVAPVAEAIQELAGPGPIITEVESAIRRTSRLEIAAATALAKAFVDAGVNGAPTLPTAVAAHGAANAVVDLDSVSWLLSRREVPSEDVFMGLRGSIKEEPLGRISAALDGLNANRRQRWDVGKALVERAAAEAVGARAPWLEAALPSRAPSKKHERRAYDDYEAALNTAVGGDSSVDDIVRELRQQLG